MIPIIMLKIIAQLLILNQNQKKKTHVGHLRDRVERHVGRRVLLAALGEGPQHAAGAAQRSASAWT